MKTKKEYPKLVATGNDQKFEEINSIFKGKLSKISIDLREIQDKSVENVAAEKAKEAFERLGESVLVEDTGLEIECWDGLPGAMIKWFLKTIGNEGIVKMTKGKKSTATAKTAVAFFDGKESIIKTGTVKGRVSSKVRGENGFGWDAIFIPEESKKTFGEMTLEEKEVFSMRKVACKKIMNLFE